MQHRRSLFKTKKRYNEIIEKRDFHKNLLKKLLKKKNEKKKRLILSRMMKATIKI